MVFGLGGLLLLLLFGVVGVLDDGVFVCIGIVGEFML